MRDPNIFQHTGTLNHKCTDANLDGAVEKAFLRLISNMVLKLNNLKSASIKLTEKRHSFCTSAILR